jgi:hypothetical protein
MPFCPSCSAELSPTDAASHWCWNCDAYFGPGAAWSPLEKAEGTFELTAQHTRFVPADTPMSPGSRLARVLLLAPLAIVGVLLLLLSHRLSVAMYPAVVLLLLSLFVFTSRSKLWISVFVGFGYVLLFMAWSMLQLLVGVGR